jgi:hypothetical protein
MIIVPRVPLRVWWKKFGTRNDSSAGSRPSAMATQQSAPIFVRLEVWDEVEDMTEVLRKIQQEGPDTEQSDEEEES